MRHRAHPASTEIRHHEDLRSVEDRVVEDELLSPVLAFISVLSALQGSERAFGTGWRMPVARADWHPRA